MKLHASHNPQPEKTTALAFCTPETVSWNGMSWNLKGQSAGARIPDPWNDFCWERPSQALSPTTQNRKCHLPLSDALVTRTDGQGTSLSRSLSHLGSRTFPNCNACFRGSVAAPRNKFCRSIYSVADPHEYPWLINAWDTLSHLCTVFYCQKEHLG